MRIWLQFLLGFLLMISISLLWFNPKPGTSVAAQFLTQTVRPDGRQEVYYTARDQFLVAGFDLLNQYWSEIASTDGALLRGHIDQYLPLELQALNYRPADTMMAAFAQSFFAARHPQTGLIPFSYDRPLYSRPELTPEGKLRTGNKQPVALIGKAAEFCQWFAQQQALQNQCLDLAQSTIRSFDVSDGGLWGWVDVNSGAEPRSPLTLIQDYGEVAKGFAYLAGQTADPDLLRWANQKLQFIWQHRMHDQLPILHEQFALTQAVERPEENSSDTDTLYYVRHLFELFDLTANPQYRDWALAVTDLWFERAWSPQWGHFIRKLNPDGSQAVDTLYGDGKYNTLYILVHAYEVTKDPRYLQRLQLAWRNLVRMGEHGLAPAFVRRGRMVTEKGLDQEQTIFLDILVRAYEVSGDRAFLQAAEALGESILNQGPTVMRRESGQAGRAFLRLALARQAIARLELNLGQPGTRLQIQHEGKSVLQVTVPGEVAVIYLPEGTYSVAIDDRGLMQQKTIQLQGWKGSF